MNHTMRLRFLPSLCLALAMIPRPSSGQGADSFSDRIQPFLKTYCLECHNATESKGELNLEGYRSSQDVIGSFRRWQHIIEFVRDGEMPPEEYRQPSPAEVNAVIAAIEAILLTEARKSAGDPGVVLPRRLSNSEYDRSIRDLTGVDIRPTQDFPPDPAGGEGFDNTGEALRMSPNLFKKYLGAAQHVADHLVLKPDGIVFAPAPVTSYNERRSLTEQAIIDFYESHDVDVNAYIESAWRFRFRGEDKQGIGPGDWAKLHGLSPRYFELVWNALNGLPTDPGLFAQLRREWQQLPAPTSSTDRPTAVNDFLRSIEFAQRILNAPRQQLIRSNAGNWPISHLDFRSQVAAARDQFDPTRLHSAALLRSRRIPERKPADADSLPLKIVLEVQPAFAGNSAYVIVKNPVFSRADRLPNNDKEAERDQVETLRSLLETDEPDAARRLEFGTHPAGGELDADSFALKIGQRIEIELTHVLHTRVAGKQLLVPLELDLPHSQDASVFVRQWIVTGTQSRADEQVEHLIDREGKTVAALSPAASQFCAAFPNRFYYVDPGRGLAAGFHLVEGFFRDDQPLVTKVLSEEENLELDRLWSELDFVTQRSETLLRGFVWFERSEREVLHDQRFDFLRPEDPQLVELHLLERFEKLYLDKLGIRRVEDTLEPVADDARYRMVHGFFEEIRQGLKRYDETLRQAELRGLADLQDLARRAYRRTLSAEEIAVLTALYGQLRQEGQSVENSLRGVLTAVLMSPNFCYRFQQAHGGEGIYPLTDQDLASRLSYFLWSSLPDEELFRAASTGQLQDTGRLVEHTRRMLKDPRIEAFSREFFGQWLRYRDFLVNDPLNASAFAGYDDELKLAMFEEPARLATDLIQRDRPITELLNSDRTFVNRRLAEHYGGDILQQYNAQLRSQVDARVIRDASKLSPWLPVSDLRASGRGGLFGMAVVLTSNSSGERTSPVKRGFWTVHHLLGQHFPPPPADVPELPKSEETATRTIRELLAAHVEDTRCAMCHRHFDSLGLAMEGFDPLGRPRTLDLAGRPIDSTAELPGGSRAEGIPGLIDYVVEHRRQEFIRTLCRKFLGYALGRSVLLSDQPLLEEMQQELETHGGRFSVLFEVVVRSPQFREQRGREFVTGRPR